MRANLRVPPEPKPEGLGGYLREVRILQGGEGLFHLLYDERWERVGRQLRPHLFRVRYPPLRSRVLPGAAMKSILIFLLFMLLYFLVMGFVLPRLGVPT